MSETGRPRILVTNDDGIAARGIQCLAESMTDFGDVYVVAPDSPQSGMSHAVTFSRILRLSPFEFGRGIKEAYACSGTPVDCVKLAVSEVFGHDNLPELLVSGINHGSNASINVIYSGTMAAAADGAISGIPSIGFSLLDEDADADFIASVRVARTLARQVLEHGLPNGTCLNVNIPKLASEDLKGIKVCRQAMGYWRDSFDQRTTPGGRPYYWMRGEFKNPDKGEDTDIHALQSGHASVVPVQFDLTDHRTIDALNRWNLSDEG